MTFLCVAGSLGTVGMLGLSGTAAAAGASRSVPSSANQKPLIAGLVDKGSEAPYHRSAPFAVTSTTELDGDTGAFAGIVVNVTWAQVEPTEGAFDFAPLQASLAAVSRYNATHPKDRLAVKLRVWAGFTAPGWAKAIGGAPIAVPGTSAAEPGGSLGRYWTAPYGAQWTRLQGALAHRYDDDPLVDEVAVTSCATASAEPFVMGGGRESDLGSRIGIDYIPMGYGSGPGR